jgi:hypothetical protein
VRNINIIPKITPAKDLSNIAIHQVKENA